jgi:hypothetical protein
MIARVAAKKKPHSRDIIEVIYRSSTFVKKHPSKSQGLPQPTITRELERYTAMLTVKVAKNALKEVGAVCYRRNTGTKRVTCKGANTMAGP